METDCLVSGPAEGWEFTVPRRVCELDGVVTRDASGSHFLGPLKGSSVWENVALDFSLGRSCTLPGRYPLLLLLRVAALFFSA